MILVFDMCCVLVLVVVVLVVFIKGVCVFDDKGDMFIVVKRVSIKCKVCLLVISLEVFMIYYVNVM